MRAKGTSIRAIIAAVLAAITLVTSGPLGGALAGTAWAHPVSSHPSKVRNAGGPAFKPTLKAPTLPVGAWKAPQPQTQSVKAAAAPTSTPAVSPSAGRKPGEQPDLRTANTETVPNADGSWTLDVSSVPIHYQDAQGKWQPIDNTVVGDMSDSGYTHGNKANDWHVHFTDQAGGATLMHLQASGVDLKESLEQAQQVPGTASGQQMSYAGIFPNVDLLYGLGSIHIEETLLLHSAQVPASYTFSYHVPGVKVSQDAAGNVMLTDAHDGHEIFSIGGVQMFEADAQGHMLPTGAGTQGVKVTLTGTGPDFTLTLTPDEAWLDSPSRHFPVAIDPTIGPLSSATTNDNTSSGNVYSDTLDESANPTWSFYNNSNERTGNCNSIPSSAAGYDTGTNRSYIKFPIGTLPANAHVTYGNLNLYQVSAFGGSTSITANAILTSWNAYQLTWNNHPTSFSYAGTGTAKTTYNNWITVDVTEAAYAWIQAGVANNGLEIQYSNESVACDAFASDDYGADQPQLQIGYWTDTTAPSGSVTPNGTYTDASGNVYTNSQTVSLATTNTDAGTGAVWNSSWTSVNGVSDVNNNGPYDARAAAWSVDQAGSQLNSDTSTCGATACWVQTFFYQGLSGEGSTPTFTATFMTDATNNFEVGVLSSGNSGTRFMLHGGSSGFTTLMYSTATGSWNNGTVSIAFSPNTWYNVQVSFPYNNAGEFRIWPVGQARPGTPTVYQTGILANMANLGLVFQHNGDNSANLHHFYVGNVNVTTAVGVWGMRFSNDGSTWSCPAPVSGTWCVASGRQTGWSLPAGDGTKIVYVQTIDNFTDSVTSLGNRSGSIAATKPIILDTTLPTASIATPISDRELRGVVTISGAASDPGTVGVNSSGVGTVSLYVDGVQSGTGVAGMPSPTFLWDTTNVAAGAHELTFQATDNAGNVSISTGVTVIVSNTGQMPYETFAARDLPDGGHTVAANVGNGDTVVTHQDIDIAGLGPDLALGRTYNSIGIACAGLFGCGWTSDLDEHLRVNGDGSATYLDPDGGVHDFLPNGGGGYLTSPGLYLTLVKNGDGTFTLTAHDQTKTNFSTSGLIASVVDRNGNTLTYSYSGSTPTTVTDATGRQLALTVSGGHVTSIAAPGSRTYGYGYDGNGNLTSYTDSAGTVTQYNYDGSHRLTSIVLGYQPGGNTACGQAQAADTNVVTCLTYDSANRLVKLLDPLNYDVGLTYTPPGGGLGMLHSADTQVQQLQTNASTTPPTTGSVYETTTYAITADGSAVQQMTNATNSSTTYQYDGNENETQQVMDPGSAPHLAQETDYQYDANGNETKHVVDPGGLALETDYTYDSANNLQTETGPVLNSSNHNLRLMTQYSYDSPATGNVTSEVQNYVSNISGSNVNSSGGTTGDIDTNLTTTSTYDSHGELLTQKSPTGVTTKYVYDSQGDVLQTIENYQPGAGQDSQTNVTTTATYDALGEKLTETDALGVVTQYAYDSRGNVYQTIANYQSSVSQHNVNSSGGTTGNIDTNLTSTATFDQLGRQTSATNPRGKITQTSYDADGRVIETEQNYVSTISGQNVNSSGGTDGDLDTNVTTTTKYDAAGNATQVTDPKNNLTVTTFDDDNRATDVQVQNSSQQVQQETQTAYDAAGRTASTTVVNATSGNQVTSYTYDGAGRTATETDPDGNVTTSTYDGDGNVTDSTVTNPSSQSNPVSETQASFDGQNRQISKTEAPGGSAPETTTYVYDAGGRQTSTTDPKGNTTTTAYDALGRTLTVNNADGSQQAMTYDAAGHQASQTNCGGTAGKTGETADSYDGQGRVLDEVRTDCSSSTQSTVVYQYDADGNKTQEQTTYPGNVTTTLALGYDNLDRLSSQTDGTHTYIYDANGNVTEALVRNGSATATEGDYSYDGANRVTGLTDYVGQGRTQIWTDSYIYDGSGNRATITEQGTATTYTYDSDNQLMSEQVGSGTPTTYQYDDNHNRKSLTNAAGTTQYSYDPATAELQTKTDASGKVTNYAYDQNGSLTKATYDPSGANQMTSYTYDAANRLSSVTEPSGTQISFAYDADGNRTSKSVTSNGTTSTVNDVYQLARLAYETDGSGTILASFTYDSAGVPTSVVVGSDPTNTADRYYYVYNGHGDTVGLVDANGNTVASYSYDSWGLVTSDTDSFSNGWHNPYLYDGKDGVRYDAETGLYWMNVRAYDPTIGRFISRDPLGRAPLMGWSDQPYAYAGNNPLLNVDPSGQRFAMETSQGGAGNNDGGGMLDVVVQILSTFNIPALAFGGWVDHMKAVSQGRASSLWTGLYNAKKDTRNGHAARYKAQLRAAVAESKFWRLISEAVKWGLIGLDGFIFAMDYLNHYPHPSEPPLVQAAFAFVGGVIHAAGVWILTPILTTIAEGLVDAFINTILPGLGIAVSAIFDTVGSVLAGFAGGWAAGKIMDILTPGILDKLHEAYCGWPGACYA